MLNRVVYYLDIHPVSGTISYNLSLTKCDFTQIFTFLKSYSLLNSMRRGLYVTLNIGI